MEPYPMKWFRLYDEALNDPKVQRLPDAAFKCWINLLCLANKGSPRGRINPGDVAYALRISDDKTDKMIAYFLEKGLLEYDGTLLVPHAWDDRQFISDNVTERTRKHRGNVSSNVAGNVPAPLQGTPPDTEQIQIQNRADAEPPLSPTGGAKKKPSRMTDDWVPSQNANMLGWAAKEGIPEHVVHREVEQFRDHWIGKGESRVDWDASFRTWLRRANTYHSNGNGRHEPAGDEAMAAWVKVAEELQQPGSAFPDGKIPKRVWRAAQAVGGLEAIDVTNGYHRRDFMVAYRELGATS